MEESSHVTFFRSLPFLRKLVGLNYHVLRLEQGQRKRLYEAALALPIVFLLAVSFFKNRNPESSTYRLEQYVVCGLVFIGVYGLTRFTLKCTSDRMKEFMDDFEKKKDLLLRKIMIRFLLGYYGIMTVLITIAAIWL